MNEQEIKQVKIEGESDEAFRLPVRVIWSPSMECFVAIDEVFYWHGQGATVPEALQDLADTIQEDYEELTRWKDSLSPELDARLKTMMRYFGYAG